MQNIVYNNLGRPYISVSNTDNVIVIYSYKNEFYVHLTVLQDKDVELMMKQKRTEQL